MVEFYPTKLLSGRKRIPGYEAAPHAEIANAGVLFVFANPLDDVFLVHAVELWLARVVGASDDVTMVFRVVVIATVVKGDVSV